jgi:hypothetical protein
MKRKSYRPIITKGSPVVPILAALTLLWFGIYGMPFALGEIKAGWAYSPGVVFDSAAKIYRNSSPVSFWINVGLHIFGFVLAIALGIFTFIGLFIDRKRKIAAGAKKKAQPGA